MWPGAVLGSMSVSMTCQSSLPMPGGPRVLAVGGGCGGRLEGIGDCELAVRPRVVGGVGAGGSARCVMRIGLP